jgi:hypothetical protein
MIFMEE